MNFGTTLRTTRKRRGVTQRELAELVGVDHTYLSKVENNRMLPSVRTIRRIARAISVDADELLTAAGRTPCRCVALKEQQENLVAVLCEVRNELLATSKTPGHMRLVGLIDGALDAAGYPR